MTNKVAARTDEKNVRPDEGPLITCGAIGTKKSSGKNEPAARPDLSLSFLDLLILLRETSGKK